MRASAKIIHFPKKPRKRSPRPISIYYYSSLWTSTSTPYRVGHACSVTTAFKAALDQLHMHAAQVVVIYDQDGRKRGSLTRHRNTLTATWK